MITDVTFKCTCTECKKEISNEEANIICDVCEEKNFTNADIKFFVKDLSDNNHWWMDKETIEGLSESEKEIFLRGSKYGHHNALFWLCDFFLLMEFFEEKIQEKFYPSKKEKNES